MKILSSFSQPIVVLSLTVGTCLIGMQSISANPIPTIDQVEQKESSKSANQLGGTQEIQGDSSTLNRSNQNAPKFEILGKSSRPRGILNVLNGRFNDQDRHPSFRKLEDQR